MRNYRIRSLSHWHRTRLKATGPVSAGVKLSTIRHCAALFSHCPRRSRTPDYTTQVEWCCARSCPCSCGRYRARHKQRYIITDCAREARARDIPSVTLLIPLVNPLSAVSPIPGALAQGKGMALSAHFSAPLLPRYRHRLGRGPRE